MPIQDFLITFRADTTQALRDINALATRVKEIDAALNTAMGRLNNRAGGPLAGIAQGAAPAAAGIGKIDQSLRQLGAGAQLTKEEVQALLVRLNQLKTGFAQTNRPGRGFQINQGQVREALTIVEKLRQAHEMSAADANKWAGEITRAYAKVASVPKSLRGMPIAEQQRFLDLRKQAANELRAFNRTENTGRRPDFKAQQVALQRYVATLKELSQFGGIAAKDLEALERKLTAVSAAASLQTQRRGGVRTIDQLRQRQASATIEATSFRQSGNARGELAGLRSLEKALIQLEARGDPVQKELVETRRRIEELNQAALRAKGLQTLLNRRASLTGRQERAGIRTGMVGGSRDLIRASMRNEEALASLGDSKAPANLARLQAQFAGLPAVMAPATQRMIEFNRTLQARVMAGEALGLAPQSAGALTKGLMNGLELTKQGFDEGSQAVDFFGQRVAALPPTLSKLASGMVTHSRRVAEGLLIYEAFGRAVEAVGKQIELINNLAREEIRFGAVAGGLGAGGSAGFQQGLIDIATRTNTPMDELAGQLDSVASALLDVGDASEVAAQSQAFLDIAGQATNITQRDLASETENLLGIYRTTGDTVDQFADRFGRITVAGRNSSVIISGIIDVLSEAGRSAKNAGVDMDFLTAVAGEMVQDLRGTMSGSEIGGILNTMLGRLTDPTVVSDLEEIVGSVFELRDATGQLRPGHEIIIDLFEAIKQGKLDIERGDLALDQIIPPLNPAARALIEETLGKNLPDALARMGPIIDGNAESAKKLSEALVSGPGEQFARAMKEIQGALTGIFTDEVISAGNTFAGLLKSIAGLLGAGESGGGVGGAVVGLGAKILIFAGVWKAASFAYNTFMTILTSGSARMKAIEAQYLSLSGTTLAASRSVIGANTAMAVSAARLGTAFAPTPNATRNIFSMAGALGTMKGALTGVLTVAKSLLPILVAMAAIELPGQISESFAIGDKMDEVLGRTALKPEDLRRAVNDVQGPAADINKFVSELIPSDLTTNQKKNMHELAEAMTELADQGKLTAETQKLLEQQIIGTGGAVKEGVIASEDLIANVQAMQLSTDGAGASTSFYNSILHEQTEALEEVTAAEQKAAESAEILAGLNDERAAALKILNDQLAAGSITLDEWSEGNDNAAAAAEAASEFMANYANSLSVIPGLQERMAATGATAAEALFAMLLESPQTISERTDIINQMNEIAEANTELAGDLEDNPIEFTVNTQRLIDEAAGVEKIMTHLGGMQHETAEIIRQNPIEPQIALDKLRAQLKAALTFYRVLLGAQVKVSSAMAGANPELIKAGGVLAQSGSEIAGLEAAIAELEAALGVVPDALASALGDTFTNVGTFGKDDPRLGDKAKEPPQTGLLDIDTLPASVVKQIVAAASAAQRAVVAAGGEVSEEDTTAIFKDANFLRLVKGIDQRFLQQAIEELTEVERRRLELEQQRLQDVTRSTVVQTGPIQSIVSAPVLAAGGGVLSGGGLNADPRLGNFTINVPINWSGMSLTQLQQFITASISKAFIDAQRGA